MTPLRFANPSPSSGWIEDFHLQAVVHTRHTACGPPAEKNAGGRYHRCSRDDRPSLRDGFLRLWRALPGVRLDSHRRHEDDHPTGLAPASGRQDHAASRPQEPRSSARPSGHAARPRGHRIPASRLVTIAKRPLQAKRDGPRNHEFWKRESRFLPAAWTDRPIHLKARMKSVFRRSRFGG